MAELYFSTFPEQVSSNKKFDQMGILAILSLGAGGATTRAAPLVLAPRALPAFADWRILGAMP